MPYRLSGQSGGRADRARATTRRRAPQLTRNRELCLRATVFLRMSKKNTSPTKPKLPRGRGSNKPASSTKINQATIEDMQREGLGIAAKE